MGIGFDNQMGTTNVCGIDYNRFPEGDDMTKNFLSEDDSVFDGVKVLELHLSNDGVWILNHNFKNTDLRKGFEVSTAIRQGQPTKADNLILDAIEKVMAHAVEATAKKSR